MSEEKTKLTVIISGTEPRVLTVNWNRAAECILVDCEHCKKNHAEFNSITGRLFCPECQTLEFLA